MIILLKTKVNINGNSYKMSIDTNTKEVSKGAYISSYSDYEFITSKKEIDKVEQVLWGLNYTIYND